MNLHSEPELSGSQTGFTLVELIIVIVVLGIISAYAVMKSVSPGEVTLPSQAETMASNIRHAQTLAYTSGKRMSLTIIAGTNGSYSVACVTTPCSTDFSVTLEKNVVLASTAALVINSLGQPSAAASYDLCFPSCVSGSKKTISVAALTGLVTVSP